MRTSRSPSPDRRARLTAGLVASVTALAYAVLSVRRFARFEPSSWDNAIFEQAIQGYSRWQAPIVDVKGVDYVILGDHFSPIYAVLGPVYRLVPAAQTLLVAQAVLIALSAYVVTSLAMRHLGALLGLVLGLGYAVSFGIQSAVKAEFHEVAFGAPLLALAGAAFVERRFGAVVGWSLPLLLVKEDLGLTVAVIGGVLWLAGERRRGLWLAAAGVVGFLVVVGIVLPAFNPDGAYAYGGSLGGERGLFGTLFAEADRKAGTALLTVAITGLAALASPWVLLVLPTFAWRFAGDVEFYWGTEWHYSLLLMPIVFVAAIDAIKRRPWLRLAVLVGAVVTAFTVVGSPLLELADPELYRSTERADVAREAIALVPRGESVESDITFLGHLVTDHPTYWVGTSQGADPQHVLFDTTGGLGSPRDAEAYAEQTYGGDWVTRFDKLGFQLASRSR